MATLQEVLDWINIPVRDVHQQRQAYLGLTGNNIGYGNMVQVRAENRRILNAMIAQQGPNAQAPWDPAQPNVINPPQQPQVPPQGGQQQGQQPPQQPIQPVQPQPAPQPAVAPLAIIGQTNLTGQVNVPFQANFTAVGGQPPYGWVINGAPAWVQHNQGNLSGMPTQAGQSQVTLTLTDGHGPPANLVVWITIQPAPAQAHNQHGHGGINWRPWIIAGAVLAGLIAILIFGPPLVDWIGDRIDAFGDENPELVDRDDDDNNDRDDTRTRTDEDDDDGDTIQIGGLEVTTSDDFENGVEAGQIRQEVPAGYLVIGDATVNGRPPDSNAATGLITVLFEPAMVIGTNESSLQRLGKTSWQQVVRLKATEMRLNGCMNGCTTVIVVDQDGNRLKY